MTYRFFTAVILLCLSLGVGMDAGAQTRSYNIKKAYEILNESGDEDKALEYVDKELKENPYSSDAILLKNKLLVRQERTGGRT